MTQPIDLRVEARDEMLRDGFEPDFPPAVTAQVAALTTTEPPLDGARDLRGLLWSSIDNPESRDLDQVEYVEARSDGSVRVMIGIADVDSRIGRNSPADLHAGRNTTSVYCGVTVFPMLPEKVSTGLTSMNEGVDRLAVVIEFLVAPDGTQSAPEVYPALLRNQAQLDYPSVGAWLEGRADPPAKVQASAALAEQLRVQDRAADAMRGQRHRSGALDFETIEAVPVVSNGTVTDLKVSRKTRASLLIEDFMIGANVIMARFLERKGIATIRRVVKAPERWNRIVDLAKALGESLPSAPDSAALAGFLARQRARDPIHFADLSLSVVKLLGPGEYEVQAPGATGDGHFGLAVHDYTHSTAPNRRFADLVTQRLLKGVLAGKPSGYDLVELTTIAAHCTKMEDAARKVERTVRKQAAALMLSHRVGESFDAIVTGANRNGTFVRTLVPPAEGMVVRGKEGMDVGDKVRVRLVDANPSRGFIDFEKS